ncbi:S53 family peptidase [Danxiaibacter flavus]|uniref:S53 family peptidase n=1 Tax=Danxiaibacter flavus TaxID=3049108 RepID=A0ABV3ZA25_9BACT|nr:S53 family peptidase [Chitinophagaceae bacterium DXS]
MPTKTNYVQLRGSAKAAPSPETTTTKGSRNEKMDVTIRVRRKQSIEKTLEQGKRYSHAEYEKMFGASAEDMARVEKFLKENKLSVVESDSARRTIIAHGRAIDFEKAFQLTLSHHKHPDGTVFRTRTGYINVPADLENVIEGVFGLDNRPVARPMFRMSQPVGMIRPNAATFQGYSPVDVGMAYGFPPNQTGEGQCIGIIELGGGYKRKDLTAYFKSIGVSSPSVKAVSIDGGKNTPTGEINSADAEVALDIEVAGAIAPKSKIVVYFAPNTDKGFLDAITTAVHDTKNKPSVISISWGAAENAWTTQSLNSYNEAFKAAAVLGITICAAAGDDGSADRVSDGKAHVDFPSSSPYILACGGTKLAIQNNAVSSEIVWNESAKNMGATGGGVSDFFTRPTFQSKTKIPKSVSTGFKGRGLPDIAGNADPQTGYRVRVDGQTFPIGGTSAVAPLMAGLIALVNEAKGMAAGYVHPGLYSTPAKFCRDITKGNNITTSTQQGYKAKKGWDACTGWGVMNSI